MKAFRFFICYSNSYPDCKESFSMIAKRDNLQSAIEFVKDWWGNSTVECETSNFAVMALPNNISWNTNDPTVALCVIIPVEKS